MEGIRVALLAMEARRRQLYNPFSFVEQSADPATSIVHFIQHGEGHALDVAGTLLADALKDSFDTNNLFLTELVPGNREVAADGDPDFDLVTDVARKIGVERLEGLLRQTGRPKGIGSPAYNASKTNGEETTSRSRRRRWQQYARPSRGHHLGPARRWRWRVRRLADRSEILGGDS